MGESAGYESVTLTQAQMPAHNHIVASVSHANEEANTEDPSNNFVITSYSIHYTKLYEQ